MLLYNKLKNEPIVNSFQANSDKTKYKIIMKEKNLSNMAYLVLLLFSLLVSCKENSFEKTEPTSDSNKIDLKKSENIAPLAVQTNTSTNQETGFEDGSIFPFMVCTTQNPNYGQPFTKDGVKCMKFYWTQVGFDGTRMDKGAEACSSLNFYKEGWFGFSFYLPSPGYPTDKEVAIGQIFSEGTTGGGCSSWSGLLIVRNNMLYLQRRTGCVAPTEVLIASDIQRNAWKPVVIHFKASRQNAGLIEVWYAGAGKSNPTYRATGINFAAGAWVGDSLDSSIGDNMIKLKFGMYCYDSANYVTGESRVVYFDNVSMLMNNPGNAWETVHPNL